jgi:hypothetical protein
MKVHNAGVPPKTGIQASFSRFKTIKRRAGKWEIDEGGVGKRELGKDYEKSYASAKVRVPTKHYQVQYLIFVSGKTD